MSSHWHILGAGSIGLLWAAELRKAGYIVSLISHKTGPHPTAITLDGEAFDVSIVHNSEVSSIQQLLITTKTWQTLAALESIRSAINEQTQIVLLQNGMANQTWLAENFPHNPVFAAITTDGAWRENTWQVKRTGFGSTYYGGLTAAAKPLQLDLHCHLGIEKSDDIQAALWIKLAMNCCINPLTALYDCLNGDLLQIPQALEQTRQILIECHAVAEKLGMAYALEDIENKVLAVMQSTAINSSSMREDFRQSRATEIDAINGFIVEQAQRFNLSVPLNADLVKKIKG